MVTCRLCGFESVPDDTWMDFHDGHGLCLRCFARETETAKAMPRELRADVERTLYGVDALTADFFKPGGR